MINMCFGAGMHGEDARNLHILLIFLIAVPYASYLLGSIPFGLVLCRLIKGVDIREHGSKNIGAANAGRVCGWPFFIATLALDFAKGFLPVVLSMAWIRWFYFETEWVHPEEWELERMTVFYGVCAVLGHTFPIYLRLKGGKAVATGFGVFVALAPGPAFIAFGVWCVVFAAFRYVSLASMCGAVTAPIAYTALYWPGLCNEHWTVFLFAVAVAVLVLVRHRSNIKRLLAGTEPKFVKKTREGTATTTREFR